MSFDPFKLLVGKRRPFRLVLFLIVGSAIATYAAQQWSANRIVAEADAGPQRAATDALNLIQKEFDDLQSAMIDEARSLARSAPVVRGLREFRVEDSGGDAEIIRFLAGYALPERESVEVYSQEPRMVGWSGATMPLDSAPGEAAFLERMQVKIARDGPDHAALSVWWPVQEGNTVLGVVRVLRVIDRRFHVRNEFLQEYSLEDEWVRMTGLRVEVSGVSEDSPEEAPGPNWRVLYGLDGSPLLSVDVTPPTLEQLISKQRQRYLDVIFLWVFLAVVLVLYGASAWCINGTREEGKVRDPLYRFLILFGLITGARYLFIAIDVPGRWQPGKAPLSPLFDPRHLASDFGWGLMKSTGDLLVTAIMVVVLAMVFVRVTEPVRRKMHRMFMDRSTERSEPDRGLLIRLGLSIAAHSTITLCLVALLAEISRRTVLDSTLDFFEHSGLLPDSVVMIVFTSLLLMTFSVIFFASRSLWVCLELAGLDPILIDVRRRTAARALIAAAVATAAVYILADLQNEIQWVLAIIFIATAWLVALYSPLRSDKISDWLHLRSVIPSVVLVSVLLYPVLENGLAAQRRLSMRAAAESFQDDVDARVLFAVDRVLDKENEVRAYADSLQQTGAVADYDSLARTLTHGELIAALGAYDVTVVLYDEAGRPIGRYIESGQLRTRALTEQSDIDAFDLIHAMYLSGGSRGRLIEKMTGRQDQDLFAYEGFAPILRAEATIGWLLVRARPEENAPAREEAFPRVLTPAGFYGNLSTEISVSEFQNGLLSRNIGRTLGKNTLDATVDADLNRTPSIWRVESTRDRDYLTLYVRPDPAIDSRHGNDPLLGSRVRTIVVRLPDIGLFDHLYYLLRITMAGLLLGLPIYLVGIWWRMSRGLLPARRVRFRDKVLNAFFVAGIITVTGTGWLGLRVVTGENDRAAVSWLNQHLERVEATLLIDARSEELPYSVLERSDLDSLSARVGLDLNVYIGAELDRSSRPQLVRERLINKRLPVEAYEAIFLDGFRYVSVNQSLGSFAFTAGYRALLDESGFPRYVLSLPTLPEQERIEEERARTVAYLFGALLLLVLVVMVTAALLANALARPIAGLRAGLQAVSEGRFERIRQVNSRDELADLVDTFNMMQSQLEENRYLLAQQERQLAWQEMARQVAHEIRNPLTPMKLAVQHLQKAFQHDASPDTAAPRKPREDFASRFTRTTATLVEQIDALANIAEEFSSFGRFPQQVRRQMDLNEIVTAAVQLMRNESRVRIEIRLADRPLYVLVDEESIRRLLINLLKNALQAIEDEKRGLIVVETEFEVDTDSGGTTLVKVIDNGGGIPEGLWNRIFVPSFSTKTSGTGLGLAIARKTVEDHEGEIGFETGEGEGTTFWIRLKCVSP